MKKTLFFVLAVVGFMTVNAQASDNSTANINITVVKTVQISPSPVQNSFDVTFDKPGQFGNPQKMSDAPRSWVINSTDPGRYQIEFVRGTIPPQVNLTYDLYERIALISTQTPIATGVDRTFDQGAGWGIAVMMYANVPWGVKAGNYSGTMKVTATAP